MRYVPCSYPPAYQGSFPPHSLQGRCLDLLCPRTSPVPIHPSEHKHFEHTLFPLQEIASLIPYHLLPLHQVNLAFFFGFQFKLHFLRESFPEIRSAIFVGSSNPICVSLLAHGLFRIRHLFGRYLITLCLHNQTLRSKQVKPVSSVFTFVFPCHTKHAPPQGLCSCGSLRLEHCLPDGHIVHSLTSFRFLLRYELNHEAFPNSFTQNNSPNSGHHNSLYLALQSTSTIQRLYFLHFCIAPLKWKLHENRAFVRFVDYVFLGSSPVWYILGAQ